jgi:hypothetical protein
MPLQDEGFVDAMVDAKSLEVDVWPNPAQGGAVQLRVTGTPEGDAPLEIEVLDALGRVLHTKRTAASGQIFLEEAAILPKGTYLVRVRAGEAVLTKPFVVY